MDAPTMTWTWCDEDAWNLSQSTGCYQTPQLNCGPQMNMILFRFIIVGMIEIISHRECLCLYLLSLPFGIAEYRSVEDRSHTYVFLRVIDPLVCILETEAITKTFTPYLCFWHCVIIHTHTPPQCLKSSFSLAHPAVKQEHLLWKCWAQAGVLRPTPPCGHSPRSGPGHALYTTPQGAQKGPLRDNTLC